MSNRVVEIVANELPWMGEFDAYERERAARAVLSALEKAWYRVVAREPTEEMIAAAHDKAYGGHDDFLGDFEEITSALKAAHDAAPRYGEPSG